MNKLYYLSRLLIIHLEETVIKNSNKIKTRINALVVPEKYTNLHKEFIDLHVVFLRYVDLAVEPMGSYNSYSEAIVTNSERFLELYRTVTQKIPNWSVGANDSSPRMAAVRGDCT